MKVCQPLSFLPDSELDDLERRVTRHRAIVPAWQVHRLVREVRRLKALEREWSQPRGTAVHDDRREPPALAVPDVMVREQGRVFREAPVGPEAD